MSEVRLSSDIYWGKIEEKIMIVINTIMIIVWMASLVIFGMFISSVVSAEELTRINNETVKAYEALIKADREYRTPKFVLEGIRNAKNPQEIEQWLKEDDFLWKEYRRPFEMELEEAVCRDFGRKCKNEILELPFK